MRAAANALSLLAVPLNVHILGTLQEEDRSLTELSQAVGLPPASTMRAYLRTLAEWGVVERRQDAGFPGSVSYALISGGERLVFASQVLQRWLEAAPNGGIALGSPAAKSTVKALVDGWEAAIVRALAARPCTLTELDRVISRFSYPTLERRLTAMRRVGLVEPQREGSGRGTPYGATSWLREAVVPLIAAAAWERRHAPSRTAPIGRLDIEAAFLLVLPMLRMPGDLSGTCRLAVELRNGSETRYAGATATVEEGKTVSAAARLAADPDAWATATAQSWYRWINGRQGEEIELGGDTILASALADALRDALLSGHRV
jgi:DNA-binding HxlR family transcriptional regulator